MEACLQMTGPKIIIDLYSSLKKYKNFLYFLSVFNYDIFLMLKASKNNQLKPSYSSDLLYSAAVLNLKNVPGLASILEGISQTCYCTLLPHLQSRLTQNHWLRTRNHARLRWGKHA